MSAVISWHDFFLGLWLDIKSLITNVDPIVLILCFVILALVFLFFERKSIRLLNILFCVAAAVYGTFLLMITLLGREGGNESSWEALFSIYERAFSGDAAAVNDIVYNILLFVPVGLLAARYKHTGFVVLSLAVIPLCIELLQLITGRGVFEISDIINNFIGGMTGFLIARMTSRLIRFIKDSIKNE